MGPKKNIIASFIYNVGRGEELITKNYAILVFLDVPQGGCRGDKTSLRGCRPHAVGASQISLVDVRAAMSVTPMAV